jgi:hypothetical protein
MTLVQLRDLILKVTAVIGVMTVPLAGVCCADDSGLPAAGTGDSADTVAEHLDHPEGYDDALGKQFQVGEDIDASAEPRATATPGPYPSTRVRRDIGLLVKPPAG